MRRSLSSRLAPIFIWGATFFFSGYFIFHALGIGGGYGIFSLARFDTQIAANEAELERLTRHREWLAHRVELVSGERIDADLLGELARRHAGLYAPDEIVIEMGESGAGTDSPR